MSSKKSRSGSMKSDFEVYRSIVAEQQRQMELREHDERIRKQQEEDLKKLRIKKQLEEEIEAKTKRFWELNRFYRRIPADGKAEFFGDFEQKYLAWRPHGTGKLVVNQQPVIEGSFVHGEFVQGEIHWTNGESWKGKLKDNCMDGPGILFDKEKKATHVIMRKNILICTLERKSVQLYQCVSTNNNPFDVHRDNSWHPNRLHRRCSWSDQ